MNFRRVLMAMMLSVVTAFSVNAQDAGPSLFGDKDQPGNRLHNNIQEQVDAGTDISEAIKASIDSSLTDEDNTLNGESKSAVAFDLPLANQFYAEMTRSNSLIEVTKVLIESNADKAVHVITLGAVLYPDFAQEVFDGAALTGVMNNDDILVAMLQAGVDPSTVSDATAAGTAAAPAVGIVPLGAGIGAGGTGGGDTTASTN
jgi:hypothetical protein